MPYCKKCGQPIVQRDGRYFHEDKPGHFSRVHDVQPHPAKKTQPKFTEDRPGHFVRED